MPSMIDADILFKELMERSRQLQSRYDLDLKMIGEKVMSNLPPDEAIKRDAAEQKNRMDEIDKTIQVMQKISREAGNV